VLAEVNPETLVLPADEDCRNDVSGNKQEEENIVQSRMSKRIKDTKKDQASSPNNCKDHGETAEDFLSDGRISSQATPVS